MRIITGFGVNATVGEILAYSISERAISLDNVSFDSAANTPPTRNQRIHTAGIFLSLVVFCDVYVIFLCR